MLLHIMKIEQVPAHHLSAAILLPNHRAAKVTPAPWTTIPIVGLAALESTEELENGTRTFTTKLTATIPEPLLLQGPPQAYRLTSAAGLQYLLGTSQAPFPLVTQETALGGKASENTATSLIITLYGVLLNII